LKYALYLFFALLISPFIYTGIYYLVEIRPHKFDIERKIEAYSPSSSYYKIIKRMAEQEESVAGIARYAGHSLAALYVGDRFHGFWHLVGLHWQLWITVLYTEDEIFRIWLAVSPYENGRGMLSAAKYYFDNDLESLSCHQLAQLVVMVRSPSRFKPGSERSESRINEHGLLGMCGSS
jgi:hypothetical protein